ncbi:MAG TPA: HRDC domain-containing protein [Fimbriimonadaceae bacterium]|nr:HRDC domain-containing protein [Fimbriimonadaceae bacterium]HRJ97081.1 HRDC domain-containing protein [Fimbriimonadaceae bacterium]
MPPYAVFSDATLEQIAERRPTSREQFLAVSGVGLVKLEKYGNQFLEVVRAHRDEE